MFAGRCISATHAALSSTRVMGTCSSIGQAVGTAAAMAAARRVMPADLLGTIVDLQQALLSDDCYLPWIAQEMPPLTRRAKLTASQGDPEPLRDGVSRPVGDDSHAWHCKPGDWIAYSFDGEQPISEITLILDSALEKDISLSLYGGHHNQLFQLPGVVPRKLRIDGLSAGQWQLLHEIEDNHQRFLRFMVDRPLASVRVTINDLWRGQDSRVYAFHIA
jgi:hypothetical protein